ncbi:uncharacterized protein F5891DRAFT_902629, partial [Suillus fuscotomentosus]
GNHAPAVCIVCLGTHGHKFIECVAEHLWNNKFPASSMCSGKSLLVWNSDKTLCVDWQRSRGCNSRHHDEHHVCSRCLARSHGAQSCAWAQK